MSDAWPSGHVAKLRRFLRQREIDVQIETELRQHREEEERHNRQMRSYLMTTLAIISLGACATGAWICSCSFSFTELVYADLQSLKAALVYH